MSSKIAVVTDTNSSMSVEEGKELGITVIPMPFYIGGKEFLDGVTLTQEEFYERLKGGEEIHTSQPSPEEVMKRLYISLCPADFPDHADPHISLHSTMTIRFRS